MEGCCRVRHTYREWICAAKVIQTVSQSGGTTPSRRFCRKGSLALDTLKAREGDEQSLSVGDVIRNTKPQTKGCWIDCRHRYMHT